MEKLKLFLKNLTDSEAIRKIMSTVIAILLGLLAGLVVMLVVDPSQAFGGLTAILFDGISRGGEGIGEVLFKAAPLILTGLAVAFAFKTGLFNIGVSGQLMMGAFVAYISELNGLGFLNITLCSCSIRRDLNRSFMGINPSTFKSLSKCSRSSCNYYDELYCNVFIEYVSSIPNL